MSIFHNFCTTVPTWHSSTNTTRLTPALSPFRNIIAVSPSRCILYCTSPLPCSCAGRCTPTAHAVATFTSRRAPQARSKDARALPSHTTVLKLTPRPKPHEPHRMNPRELYSQYSSYTRVHVRHKPPAKEDRLAPYAMTPNTPWPPRPPRKPHQQRRRCSSWPRHSPRQTHPSQLRPRRLSANKQTAGKKNQQVNRSNEIRRVGAC